MLDCKLIVIDLVCGSGKCDYSAQTAERFIYVLYIYIYIFLCELYYNKQK